MKSIKYFSAIMLGVYFSGLLPLGLVLAESGGIMRNEEATVVEKTELENSPVDLVSEEAVVPNQNQDPVAEPEALPVGGGGGQSEATSTSQVAVPSEISGRNICKADLDNDGSVSWRDIDPMKMVVTYPEFFRDNDGPLFWQADLDDNGKINTRDVDDFVALMNKPTINCQEIPIVPISNPDPSDYEKGDLTRDGHVSWRDIDFFKMVLDYPAYFETNHPDYFWQTDIDDNAVINSEDVNGFIHLMNTR